MNPRGCGECPACPDERASVSDRGHGVRTRGDTANGAVQCHHCLKAAQLSVNRGAGMTGPELQHMARREDLGEACKRTSGTIAVNEVLCKGETGRLCGGLGAVGTRSTERPKQLPLPDQQVESPATGAADLEGAGSDGEALVVRGTHRKPGCEG